MIWVASYCRVSTDKDDQANSFESQQRYFREYIQRQPDWALYEIYADEGITGTSTKKRAAFNRMIRDARMGKFQLILTKEVSRFSRNILDTISYTRELRQIGVGVLFMNDGISTLEPDAELRLSIMGSIAQEESRKTSSRVKWGQTRKMERGVVFGRSLLGYYIKGGSITVEPEGAEVVRLIFHKYGVEKKGTSVIARELREAGILTCRGNPKWSSSHIIKILKNEKYVGDLVQKKTFTPDYLTHAKKYNHGEEALVVIRNHHQPIIDRELWDTVQEELKKRNIHGPQGCGHSNRYVFSGKIKCGECGASFVARKRYRRDRTFYRRWSCFTAVSEGRHPDARSGQLGCDVGKTLREDAAMDILRQAIQSLRIDRERIIQNVAALAAEAVRDGEQEGENCVGNLEVEIRRIKGKKEDVLDAFFSKRITEDEMRMMNGRYDSQLTSLQQQLEAVQSREQTCWDPDRLRADLEKRIADIVSCRMDSEVFYKTVLDHMTVYRDGRIEVRLHLLPQTWVFLPDNPDASPGSF